MQVVVSKEAPEAIGPYSHAIRCGNCVYLSGQIPLDPQTMQLCSEDMRLQINQVLKNLSAVCKAAGGSLSEIVKLTIYLTDLSQFALVNEVMEDYFSAPYPARATIGVKALPRGAQVEMDGILVLQSAV